MIKRNNNIYITCSNVWRKKCLVNILWNDLPNSVGQGSRQRRSGASSGCAARHHQEEPASFRLRSSIRRDFGDPGWLGSWVAGDCVVRRRGEASGDLKSGLQSRRSACRMFSRWVAAAAVAARASRVLRVSTARRCRLHTSLQSYSFAKALFLGNIEQVGQVLAARVLCFHLIEVPGRRWVALYPSP